MHGGTSIPLKPDYSKKGLPRLRSESKSSNSNHYQGVNYPYLKGSYFA